MHPKLYGAGENVRDWIHVLDHNDAERFLDAVRGVGHEHVTMAEGADTLAVVEAVLTSASENQVVRL